jgi:glyoxylase-like metal-dependent hydrolase (beta-lactamase superfamily II)
MDDILFAADHVLARITPHQSPESITRHVGLGHYLDSLRKVRDLPGVRVSLGGHEVPVTNLAERVDEIRRAHHKRLERVLNICVEPQTIKSVAAALFGPLQGYNALLGLEEAGAHVEYLYQRAELGVANLEQVQREAEPAIQYVRL